MVHDMATSFDVQVSSMEVSRYCQSMNREEELSSEIVRQN